MVSIIVTAAALMLLMWFGHNIGYRIDQGSVTPNMKSLKFWYGVWTWIAAIIALVTCTASPVFGIVFFFFTGMCHGLYALARDNVERIHANRSPQ